MRPLEADTTSDREVVYREHFDTIRREYLRMLVSPDIIEEHRRAPLGQHSEGLERLLIYFRQRPAAGKYAIKVVEPFKAYRIVALSGHRGAPPRAVDDKVYGPADEAYHGLFLMFVRDLLES
jgi:branched-chain amino acid transport system permease protein